MASLEEKVEEHYKAELDRLGVQRWGKNDAPNKLIRQALNDYKSKAGGDGRNYPDIQALLDNGAGRRIPVMMECKGSRGKLEKLDKSGYIAENPKSVEDFAVNGALHYGRALQALLPDMKECIVIGMNGSELATDGTVQDLECKAYYLSHKNGYEPKHIKDLDNDLTLLKPDNMLRLLTALDELFLTDTEREAATRRVEDRLEASIKAIHQSLYDNKRMRNALGMNEKLYLFCGLIMAGLSAKGVTELTLADFKGSEDTKSNDGKVVIDQVDLFLRNKNCEETKLNHIIGLLKPLFQTSSLWRPVGGSSMLKELFWQIKTQVIPHLESPFHLDFTGKILNSLNDWVQIENDKQNDVVLTPRYLTSSMARMCQTDMDSFVWDRAMGSAGFLVSAMDIMIRDAHANIKDADALTAKIKDIKEKQLLGIEILPNIYLLAVLNMILMGDGSSMLERDDSHTRWDQNFPANVFLLNPPYSAPGKGFNFVAETLEHMTGGYAAILIQENAGAGQGLPYTKRILKKNRLIASIRMPDKLFSGKASVQTSVYVFQINKSHKKDDIVRFIDFTNDGYSRQNRKKSSQEVNLRDIGDAAGRYAEMEARVLGKQPETAYYTKENGLYIEDTISLNGDDWTFAQHKKIDTVPTLDDFKKTVADYLAWKVGRLMRGEEAHQEIEKFMERGVGISKIVASAWKKFKIADLFTSETGDVDLQQKDVNGKGVALVSSGESNTGVIGLTDVPAKVIPENTITVDMFGSVQYRDFRYKMVTHARVFALIPKMPITQEIGLFFVTLLKKLTGAFSYNNMCSWNKIKNLEISLPVTDTGQPDWDYMQERITELEQERITELEQKRITELEQYLVAAGLNDYTLTNKDLKTFSLSLVSGVTKLDIYRLLQGFARK